ncbi:hypothetical protein IAE37_000186 [Pseudomonas sp. S31]|uniref:dermonecrotic toxin domain-containing protein n=1 Tax=Pseudomonas sp. S31 TaxID=1564473 RepID=UPI0019147C89|nr:DUF6543 domain-containing protein [Pseudomonas sp. S31]MBK4997910.1 hypothetical protein [Pseudomonas sp. S31]
MPLPLHHAQIVRTLPAWSKALNPKHVPMLLGSLRAEYLDAQGQPRAWFSQASAAQQAALRSVIGQRNDRRQALQAALTPLKGIVEYCEPLLQARLGKAIEVNQACLVQQPYEVKKPIDNLTPLGSQPPRERQPLVPTGQARVRTLLEAALHNFSGENDIRPFDRLQRSATDIQPPPGLSLPAFVGHCRQLDLGQAYQNHLESVFDQPQSGLEALWANAQGAELRVQAHIASLRDHLSEVGLAAIDQLCAGHSAPRYGQHALRCWRLSLESIPLHELLLIGPEDGNSASPVIIYLPGGEDGSLREYASRAEAARTLRQQLANATFRRQVTALAPQPLQATLERALRNRLFDKPSTAEGLRAKAHIEFSATDLPPQPWQQLHTLHVQRLKGDARTIAVPTADVDAKVRMERLEHWLDIGLTVLNVAAMFVPALNPLMLAIGAAQLMGSVFHGIEAWEDDDNAQALAQVESILLNLATVAALAGSGVVLKQSGFVDAMSSVWDAGKERLWSASLKAYRSGRTLAGSALPDAQGLYGPGDRRLLRIEGEVFEVQEAPDGQWRLQASGSAYAPRLRSNGQGAWRLSEETPLDWSDHQLLRRFGPISEPLDEADLDFALRCTATDADILRYAHINDQPPPALLADVLIRLGCDREAGAIIDAVRHGTPLAAYKHYALAQLPQLPGWPEDYVLKVFEGPEPWGRSAQYGVPGSRAHAQVVVTLSDVESGNLSKVVLEQLDQPSLARLRGDANEFNARDLDAMLAEHLQARRDDLFASLYQQRQPPLGADQALLVRLYPGLPAQAAVELHANATAAERLRLDAGRVPLHIGEEARLMQARARLDRALVGLYRPRLANADTAQLRQALLVDQPGATPETLLQAAVGDRQRSATSIGQQSPRPGFRSPMRLSDGRVGYPLSGRPRWFERLRNSVRNVPDERAQALYPSLTPSQRTALLDRLRERGDIGEQLTALEREQQTLDASLLAWEQAADEPQRAQRRALREQLNRAWRMEGDGQASNSAVELRLDNLYRLPEQLPARFDHVTSLSVHGRELRVFPSGFLQSFPSLTRLRMSFVSEEFEPDALFHALRDTPQLRELSLRRNLLTELSADARQALAQLRQLRRLDLSRNALRLTLADVELLASLPLEHLHLGSNQIVLDPAMAARLGQMTRLHSLDLSFNPELGEPPQMSGLLQLLSINLNECGLTQWPTSLGELMTNPEAQLRIIELSDNHITDIAELDSLLASPYFNTQGETGRAQPWNFEFNFNPLQARTRQRLRAIGVGVEQAEHFLADDAAVDWRDYATDTQAQTWRDLFDDEANTALREVIERLGRSAQARGNPQRLANQVWRLLTQASEDTRLRTRLNDVAGEFPATCGDAGADGFSTLEMEALAYKESTTDEVYGPYLFNVYQRLFRREQVNVMASRIHDARAARQAAYQRWLDQPSELGSAMPELPPLDVLDDLTLEELEHGMVDEIEIRLALRQALASALEFPEPSQDMLYRQTAQVSRVVEDNVAEAVRLIDDNAKARRRWIAHQPSWMRFLEQRFATRFEAVKAEWSDAQEYLDHCADRSNEPPTRLTPRIAAQLQRLLNRAPTDGSGRPQRVELNSSRYDELSRAIARDRQTALDDLYLQLTGEQDPNR